MEKRKRTDISGDKVQLLKAEPGYETGVNLYYDRKYKIGNTNGYIVAPQITGEENERRWQHVNEVASSVAEQMMERGLFDQQYIEANDKK